jgi:hypothetical protein
MRDYATQSQSVINTIRDVDATRAGYPVQSDQSGPGYHAPRSPTPGSPGWTTHVAQHRKHPTEELWAYPVPAEMTALEALKAGLTGLALAAVVSAHPLGPDWTPPGL